MIDLRLGDCLEVMHDIPDKGVDAVITDPPYNLGIDYGNGHNDNKLDYLEWCSKWLLELERVCKGAIAISCGVANLAMWLKMKEPVWILCWHKSFSVGHGAFGFSNWEPVIVYGKTGKHEKQTDYFEATFVKDKSANGHPCPKPMMWAKNLVLIVSDNGNTILDPFMGSGTTGVACAKLGRGFIGIESNPDYYTIAKKRIEEAQMQQSLFV